MFSFSQQLFRYSWVIITTILWHRAATCCVFYVLHLLFFADWGWRKLPPPPPLSPKSPNRWWKDDCWSVGPVWLSHRCVGRGGGGGGGGRGGGGGGGGWLEGACWAVPLNSECAGVWMDETSNATRHRYRSGGRWTLGDIAFLFRRIRLIPRK